MNNRETVFRKMFIKSFFLKDQENIPHFNTIIDDYYKSTKRNRENKEFISFTLQRLDVYFNLSNPIFLKINEKIIKIIDYLKQIAFRFLQMIEKNKNIPNVKVSTKHLAQGLMLYVFIIHNRRKHYNHEMLGRTALNFDLTDKTSTVLVYYRIVIFYFKIQSYFIFKPKGTNNNNNKYMITKRSTITNNATAGVATNMTLGIWDLSAPKN